MTEDERAQIVNDRLEQLMADLASEIRDQPVASLLIVHWPKSISVGATFAKLLPGTQMRILDMMAVRLARHVQTLKARINTIKEVKS